MFYHGLMISLLCWWCQDFVDVSGYHYAIFQFILTVKHLSGFLWEYLTSRAVSSPPPATYLRLAFLFDRMIILDGFTYDLQKFFSLLQLDESVFIYVFSNYLRWFILSCCLLFHSILAEIGFFLFYGHSKFSFSGIIYIICVRLILV